MNNKTKILIEALPYMKAFKGKTIVVKYGGSAMGPAAESLMQDMIFLQYAGIKPVLVHGGGPEINALLEKLGKKSRFVKGQRVTDAETMDVVEMVLAGKVNTRLVGLLNKNGVKAVGLNGKDASILSAKAYGEGLGFVGKPYAADPALLQILLDQFYLPVIAPIGMGAGGESYNINADTAAGVIAGALKAEKLLLLTDTKGIYENINKEESFYTTLSRSTALNLISSGVIEGGMVPKVQACITALEGGVHKAHIIDGRKEHAILLEIFTDQGVGTELTHG